MTGDVLIVLLEISTDNSDDNGCRITGQSPQVRMLVISVLSDFCVTTNRWYHGINPHEIDGRKSYIFILSAGWKKNVSCAYNDLYQRKHSFFSLVSN